MPTGTIDLHELTHVSALSILAVAIVVSLLKPILEATVLPATARLHDPLVRLLAVFLGILVVLSATLTLATTSPTGEMILTAVVSGVAVAVVSMAVYHLVTSNWFDTQAFTELRPSTFVPLDPAKIAGEIASILGSKLVSSVSQKPLNSVSLAPKPVYVVPAPGESNTIPKDVVQQIIPPESGAPAPQIILPQDATVEHAPEPKPAQVPTGAI